MVDMDAPSPREVAEAMRRAEGPTELFGIALDSVGAGHATVSVTLDDRMLNGFGSAHGGILFLLADQAFAYACNSENIATVAQAGSITFLSPSRSGERVVAEARRSGEAGRTGVYDVRVTADDGRVLAIFQGVSRALGRPVIGTGEVR
ncbi:MAG: hydroxyphenylacetyl-CoA thioesterase PaaI [Candidatus Sphingomonas phytovorans]|nr:hydroxyphenylacetyl-CoA thioesterase PaaI [Sphingomonas sp.]WEJ98434.1 MAG: hydroxyphenylacetyl-CoA thioesterase PaaI [Sphingomonas sp.]